MFSLTRRLKSDKDEAKRQWQASPLHQPVPSVAISSIIATVAAARLNQLNPAYANKALKACKSALRESGRARRKDGETERCMDG